jgi:hypothetical protein
MRSEIAQLNDLVAKMDRAILVTRRASGRLVAWLLGKPRQAPGADLWFVMRKERGKTDDLLNDPHVNVTFFRSRSDEWLSVAGVAKLSPAHSRMLRIGVDVRTVVAKEKDMPRPLVLLELPREARGEATNLGRMEYVRQANGEHI